MPLDIQPVWNRFGTIVSGCMTASDVLKAADLGNWNVRKTRLYFDAGTTDEPQMQRVREKVATVRNNPNTGNPEVLGIVTPAYETYQNESLAEVIDQVTDISGAHFQTAGSFRGGRRVFVNLKLPTGFTVAGLESEKHDLYLLGTTTHDGSGNARFLTTPVRVICQNTLATAMKSFETQFSIRHTGDMQVKAAVIREKLELQYEAVDAFQVEAEKMLNEVMTDNEFNKVIDQIWKPTDTEVSNRRTRTLRELWHGDRTISDVRGTNWAAYQTFVRYTDHLEKPSGDDANRVLRAVDGVGLKRKQAAFELLKVL